jgi:AraC-like DNA-binding protein
LRISVVARQLGYDSEASFSRAFKRVLGHAPSHFRAKPQGKAGFGERLLAHAAGRD